MQRGKIPFETFSQTDKEQDDYERKKRAYRKYEEEDRGGCDQRFACASP